VREIYLPELLNISIKNYTLYPKGLDFSYDFVKGFNLVIGGNGMGKTTFVSLIKYGIIGNYKKQYDYSRTYRENKIEKRIRNSESYFSGRIDQAIESHGEPQITVSFRVNETIFTVTRGLKEIKIESLYINGEEITGEVVTEEKFERLKNRSGSQLENSLPAIYEEKIKEFSGISFDDLIFFVNYILFFGEDHRTILWDEDVQKELFNTFFNSPDLNIKRQEAEREAKYFDSISRHKSEDIRAIRKVLEKIENQTSSEGAENPVLNIINIKQKIEAIDNRLLKIHENRRTKDNKLSVLSSEINKTALSIDEIESRRNSLNNRVSYAGYTNHHSLYHTFLTSIKANHVCPLCNTKSESLYSKATIDQNLCWSCGNELIDTSTVNSEDKKLLEDIEQEYTFQSTILRNKRLDVKDIEKAIKDLDLQFKDLETEKRKLQTTLRDLEFKNSQEDNTNELQAFYDEIEKLTKQKDEFSEKSSLKKVEAHEIAVLIEETIIKNVQSFSNHFSTYANKFLGVVSELTYDKLTNDTFKKFYPVIGNSIRYTEFELSESQRFFVDHSFRMSILSHFYTTPSFYIVETPDSSLDLSYEKNAADVFRSFLEYPYTLILTSNLNNSTFIDYILENRHEIEVGIIPLFEIAKKSTIQENNVSLKKLYNNINIKNNG